ncbi:MAG: glycerol-3-phosphate acyltransferase [Chloroflexi bacterium]|nr:glycerol-3-phosphate acyltransferase [Chloroflexota bacterium]MBL7062004.1 glycerol-3-phosphate acyltransferase [Dehalococcoidia bacterium]
METLYFVVLIVAAFWLGACPFALWIGKWLLGKDIRDYGDGNPGGRNVLRAGGRKAFALVLILDIGKGVPFVALAHYYFGLPDVMVMAVGLSAILGHAYSPLLRFKGGKALAVMGGVLIALPQHEILISVLIFMFLAFLLIGSDAWHGDAWRVMFGTTASLIYLLVAKGVSLEPLFMLCVVAILAAKHFNDLKTRPRLKGRLITWLQARKTANVGRQ